MRLSVATIKAGSGLIPPGMVLGRVLSAPVSGAPRTGGNAGDGVLTLDPDQPTMRGVLTGVYAVQIVSASPMRFRVTDPSGLSFGVQEAGDTNENAIRFTIASGSVPFAVGDGFDITVPPASDLWAPSPAGLVEGIEGAEFASAVALGGADATAGAVAVAAAVRDAEWNQATLTFHASVNTDTERAAKLAQLAAVGIVGRA